MNKTKITASNSEMLQCPACGMEMYKRSDAEHEMELHKSECHGYTVGSERFAVGDRVTFGKFGRYRLRDKRKLDREGDIVGFSKRDYLVRVHWDGTSENTVYRYDHRFLVHLDEYSQQKSVGTDVEESP